MKQTIFTKEGGVIRYRGSHFDLMLATIPNGEYELTIKKKVKKRTLDQNSLMWMWYKCIEDETGTPSQDIHDYYCKKFLRRKVVYNGQSRTAFSEFAAQFNTRFAWHINIQQG